MLSVSQSRSRFIITNLAAFQTLFAKLREASKRSSEMRISFPGELPVARVNRSASAPYLDMTSSGSIPLPSDLDIFLPSASRTSPWMTTSEKGFLPVCLSPENIMRDTQNVMISYPVTSALVG